MTPEPTVATLVRAGYDLLPGEHHQIEQAISEAATRTGGGFAAAVAACRVLAAVAGTNDLARWAATAEFAVVDDAIVQAIALARHPRGLEIVAAVAPNLTPAPAVAPTVAMTDGGPDVPTTDVATSDRLTAVETAVLTAAASVDALAGNVERLFADFAAAIGPQIRATNVRVDELADRVDALETLLAERTANDAATYRPDADR